MTIKHSDSKDARLNVFLARATGLSRRRADEEIFAGNVFINGIRVVEPWAKVTADDKIFFEGEILSSPTKTVWIVMNKPANYITTRRDPRGRKTVMELIPRKYKKIFPIGRLDADTTGVLLFTTDGEMANKLAHPRYRIVRKYRATITGFLDDKEMEIAKKGIIIDGRRAIPQGIRKIKKSGNNEIIEIGFQEGRYHEVKKFFSAISHRVVALDRISFAGLDYGKLECGQWRLLKKDEIEKLVNIYHKEENNGDGKPR